MDFPCAFLHCVILVRCQVKQQPMDLMESSFPALGTVRLSRNPRDLLKKSVRHTVSASPLSTDFVRNTFSSSNIERDTRRNACKVVVKQPSFRSNMAEV
jgi:hypothetical protein